jgi:hypothetical protein
LLLHQQLLGDGEDGDVCQKYGQRWDGLLLGDEHVCLKVDEKEDGILLVLVVLVALLQPGARGDAVS